MDRVGEPVDGVALHERHEDRDAQLRGLVVIRGRPRGRVGARPDEAVAAKPRKRLREVVVGSLAQERSELAVRVDVPDEAPQDLPVEGARPREGIREACRPVEGGSGNLRAAAFLIPPM